MFSNLDAVYAQSYFILAQKINSIKKLNVGH